MLIKQLYSGRRKSDLVLVKDNLKFSGYIILKKFIEEARLRGTKVHLLLTENVSYYFELGLTLNNDVTVHKYFPDPWHLLKGKEMDLSFEQIVDCVLSERIINEGTQVLFVICSLSSLLDLISLDTLCTSLKKMSSTNKEESSGIQVLGLLHPELDLEDGKEYKYLMYMASSVLTLAALHSGMSLEHRQSSGKIIVEAYTCIFNDKKELQFVVKKDKVIEKVQENYEKIIDSTFKLTLEDKEKESRNQVVLPYVKNKVSGNAKIYYEPDLNDDWDDEDPDDDLEI